MIVKTVVNPDRKWWNPFTWGRVTDIVLEKQDFLICKKLDFGQLKGRYTHDGSIYFLGKSKRMTKTLDKSLKEYLKENK